MTSSQFIKFHIEIDHLENPEHFLPSKTSFRQSHTTRNLSLHSFNAIKLHQFLIFKTNDVAKVLSNLNVVITFFCYSFYEDNSFIF